MFKKKKEQLGHQYDPRHVKCWAVNGPVTVILGLIGAHQPVHPGSLCRLLRSGTAPEVASATVAAEAGSFLWGDVSPNNH